MNVKDNLQRFSSNRTEKNREQLLSNLEKSSLFVDWVIFPVAMLKGNIKYYKEK